ncbi:MAG: CYTH domain-containing protein [Lachnospiraceae bacterium]|nr:CYTH domain-containing protein [Lachnospiraceae bacterium]
MGYEIERKFLVRTMPKDLSQYDFHLIEQAYLTKEPTIRVRREDDTYYMTYKGKGRIVHEEYNLPLNKAAYETLKSKADGNIITKKRYLIPVGSYTAELDIFDAPFAPLTLVEVEFPTEEEANDFHVPEWFGKDVTDDERYYNSYMSFAPLP